MTISANRLDELLKMDSFQDMTDEEITAVMDYRAEFRAAQAAHDAHMDEYALTMQAQRASYEARTAEAQQALADRLAAPVVFKTEV